MIEHFVTITEVYKIIKVSKCFEITLLRSPMSIENLNVIV